MAAVKSPGATGVPFAVVHLTLIGNVLLRPRLTWNVIDLVPVLPSVTLVSAMRSCGSGRIVTVTCFDACPAAFVAVAVKVYLPAFVGVPLRMPAGETVNPGGS